MRAIISCILNTPRTHRRILAPLILAIMAAVMLNGCFNPRNINDQDAVYCESKGFLRGTDANAQCALAHAQELADAGVKPQHMPVAPEAAGAPPPPPHPGSLPQTIPRTVTAGIESTITFVISVSLDCSSNGMPVVQIDKKPDHGQVKTVPRDDFARLSQGSFPLACADKKVAGLALEYTANRDYSGRDSIEFQTITKSGLKSIFKVPIKVEKPARAGDD